MISGRTYTAFWATACVALVVVVRWLLRDFADYLIRGMRG